MRLDPGPGPGEEKRNAAEPPRNSQVFVLRTKETQGGGGGGGGGVGGGGRGSLAIVSRDLHSPQPRAVENDCVTPAAAESIDGLREQSTEELEAAQLPRR